MPIEFRCSECNKLLRTGDGTAGQQAKCPECGTVLLIPTPEGGAQEGPPPPGPADGGAAGSESSFGAAGGAQPPGGSPGPENPYQSPEAGTPPGAGMPQAGADQRAYALDRVSTPATILVVFGSIGIPVAILAAVANIVMANMQGAGGMPANPFFDQMFPQDAAAMAIMQSVSAVVSVAIGILMILGGLKMKKLESHGLCVAAAIVAIIPCFSPCCCMEMPFGIWALVVLLDSRVSSAFH